MHSRLEHGEGASRAQGWESGNTLGRDGVTTVSMSTEGPGLRVRVLLPTDMPCISISFH